MSEKPGVDKIRGEIAAERQRLDDDLNALKSELRSLVPLAGGGSRGVSQKREGRSPDIVEARLARCLRPSCESMRGLHAPAGGRCVDIDCDGVVVRPP
jgi:hypothetical protein